jgi:hypothetical protein
VRVLTFIEDVANCAPLCPGRVFNSSPKLKTTKKTVPRRGFAAGRPAPPKPTPKATGEKDGMPSLEPMRPKTQGMFFTVSTHPPIIEHILLCLLQFPAEPKSQKATVEEVEDEDAIPNAGKKKKKKKPKKKKKAEDAASPVAESVSPPPTPVKAHPPPPPPVSPTRPSPQKQPPAPKSPPARSPSFRTASTTTLPNMSTTTLPFPLEQTSAQSARSYVKDIDGPKAKVKSRSDQASIFSATSGNEKEKKSGFFSKFSRKDKPAEDQQEKKGDLRSWFSKLSKKRNKLMHQLLNTSENETKGLASMKWDHFAQVTFCF